MKTLFEEFIKEYKLLSVDKHHLLDKNTNKNNTFKLIDSAKEFMLADDMLTSLELADAIKKLTKRTQEPMKVAIVGQFSSGKSTFLNALLSKNILPTGITPVTSKVNYIRYGNEYSLQVKYKDGRESFCSIHDIDSFVDQRKSIEDIEYLTLYAPLALLKEIVFIDTPGLNSQSENDTQITRDIFKEVDGIIWLSLIDNAGKMSEAEILEEHLNSYQNKSLCVLNQKDKFTPSQVEQTVSYIKNSFKKYFSEVIAISAKQALMSRSQITKVVLEDELQKDFKTLFEDIKDNNFFITDENVDSFLKFNNKREAVFKKHTEQNDTLLKESNIESVLDFIYKEIKPISENSRDFTITQDIKRIINILIKQENKIIYIFEELENILNDFEEEASIKFKELKSGFANDLNIAFSKIEDIIDSIATEIFLHVKKSKRTRYVKSKKGIFFKNDNFIAHAYEAPKIHSDDVYTKLFYDDDLIGKKFKQYLKNLDFIKDEVNKENHQIYKNIEIKIKDWQKRYEYIQKQENIESEKQYMSVKTYVSKIYENILKAYSDEIANSYAKISSEFKYLASALLFNYQNATEVAISFLESKIEKSIKLYEENPTMFSIYEPKLIDIKNRLKTSFYMYELENMMQDKKSFISKNYEKLLNSFFEIKNSKLKTIQAHKEEYIKLKNKLEYFLNSI